MTSLETILGALGVVLAAAITGYFGYMIAKRTKSGQIDTSEAATLWVEGTAMRGELRNELASAKDQLERTNIRLVEAIDAISELNREIRRTRQETEAAREETRISREETRRLMTQISDLHAETAEMHKEVKTSNDLTLGQLGDNAESRRINSIPKDKRTFVEQQHLDTAHERMPYEKRAKQDTEDIV